MKNLGKLAVLGAVIAASAPFASAVPITLGSYATGGSAGTDINTAISFDGYATFAPGTIDPNHGYPDDPQPVTAPSSGNQSSVPGASGSTTFALSPETTWTGPLANSTWVGPTANSGPTGTSPVQNTIDPPYGYYTYSTTFSLTSADNAAFDFMADDTMEVYLTTNGGTPALLVNFGNLGADGQCAAGPQPLPTCTSQDFLNELLGAGSYKLTFVVEQAGAEQPGNDPTGLDFDATLTPAATPEPSSLVLLGTGLLGSAGFLVRKFRTS